jgi:hypothetical protein
MAEGIEVRHRQGCRALDENEDGCNCNPSYRASAWSPATRS